MLTRPASTRALNCPDEHKNEDEQESLHSAMIYLQPSMAYGTQKHQQLLQQLLVVVVVALTEIGSAHARTGVAHPFGGVHAIIATADIHFIGAAALGAVEKRQEGWRLWLLGFQRLSGHKGPLTALYATSKGGATTKNNRDSRPKYLGVKKYGGEFVVPGQIIVRQRGTRFKAGDGVIRGGDDSLMAKCAGFVCMRRVHRNGEGTWRVKNGCVVSVKPSIAQTLDPKAIKVALLRTLSRSWMQRSTASIQESLAAAEQSSNQECGDA
ncbi:ribosomal protein rpl27 [Cyclospora cayetanensis]|uniref:Ribosomal protein rpl27 n=1 Tax=Cyclospora cayetanensis TaxID=88456 RepID=A0A1D3CX10_9EIME|nr:ribosomal protein rpl27 [Cyclospora cayetanensis]